MDLEPEMIESVRLVAKTLHEYARGKKWKYARNADFNRGDYFLAIVVNQNWGNIHVKFVLKEFDPRSEFVQYVDIMNHLRNKLEAYPGVVESIGLTLKSPEQYERDDSFSTGAPYVHIPQELIKYVPRKRVQGKK